MPSVHGTIGCMLGPTTDSLEYGAALGEVCMKRTVRVLIVSLIATTLAVSTMSSAIAEPGKNQIEAKASCSNGETYTFVLNGMGKAWQLEETNSNLLVKSYTLTYYDPRT